MHLIFCWHLYILTQWTSTHTHGTNRYIQHIQFEPFFKPNILFTQIISSNKPSHFKKILSTQTLIPTILLERIQNHYEDHRCLGFNNDIKLLSPIFNMAIDFCETSNHYGNSFIPPYMRTFCKITKWYFI